MSATDHADSAPPAATTPIETGIAESIPRSFLFALILGAGFFAFVAWDQSYWWRNKEDYGFGWLVPIFVAYVIYDRWPRIRATLGDTGERIPDTGEPIPETGNRIADSGKPKPETEKAAASPARRIDRSTGRRAQVVLGILAGLCAVWGVLWFLLGAFYRASAGPSNPGTLAITMGAVCIVAPLLYFESSGGRPRRPAPAAVGAVPSPRVPDSKGVGAVPSPRVSLSVERSALNVERSAPSARLRLLLLFTFPLLVWFVSAPLVSVIESALSRALLHFVVSIVRGVFDALELPIAQRGNVLVLPSGEVGMVEACSGIRSLTGCVFAGSFLAATMLPTWRRKLLLVVLGFALAIVSNLGRALFLTSWAYRYGALSIEGTLHDATGYAVLIATTLMLLAVASALARPPPTARAAEA